MLFYWIEHKKKLYKHKIIILNIQFVRWVSVLIEPPNTQGCEESIDFGSFTAFLARQAFTP